MDLAPAKVPNSFNSLLSSGADAIANLKPRERYLQLDSKPNQVTVVEICNDKIIVGLKSGQINIYNSVDLGCDAVLKLCKNQDEVWYLECTCTEIIAGYREDSIYVWDIRSRRLVDTIIPDGPFEEHVCCMFLTFLNHVS